LVHGASQDVQLPEHSLICDLPSHGLIEDDLCSDQGPVQVVLHIMFLQLGAFSDEETYGSSCQLTQDRRKKIVHLGILSSGR
jgi:hypothetical protein